MTSAAIKPLQRMWSPPWHRVESRRRSGGAHTAERQIVRQTMPTICCGRSRNMWYASPMPATKLRVRDLLERLPDDCSLDDVVYHLYVMQKVEAGLADAEAGRLIPHDVVAAELRRKWTVGSDL